MSKGMYNITSESLLHSELVHQLPGLIPRTTSNIGSTALLFALIFVSTYTYTTIKSSLTLRSRDALRKPADIPYWIPFLGNIFPFLLKPAQFFTWTLTQYGFYTPLRVRLGPMKLHMIASADHIAAIFKASKQLSPRFGVLVSLENLFGTPSDVIPFYKMDDSGASAVPHPDSKVNPEHRLNYFQVRAAHQHLNGADLAHMTEHFMKVLGRRIDESPFGDEWTEMPDLFSFLQQEVFRAAVEALAGEHLLNQYAAFVDDYWEFDRSVPTLVKGLPRWMAPRAYRVRQRLLDAVKNWHKLARQQSDFTKIGPDDPEWDPYWGSKLMRARQDYTKNLHFMNEDALAAEDLGLIFAMNTNAVPAVAWFIIDIYRSPTLLSRCRDSIAASARSNSPTNPTSLIDSPSQHPSIDITTLCASPLLQSIYAETLRLRVALVITRTPEREDFHTSDGWSFAKGVPIVTSSRTAGMNPEIWNAGTPEEPRPLDRFWAERFLVYPGNRESGPSRKDVVRVGQEGEKGFKEEGEGEGRGEPYFSMEKTAKGWIPYGGGQRMCPGRHFAKQEIIGTFALLCSRYDIDLTTPEGWEPKPDLNYFPFGGLPPVGKVPFKIRRREE